MDKYENKKKINRMIGHIVYSPFLIFTALPFVGAATGAFNGYQHYGIEQSISIGVAGGLVGLVSGFVLAPGYAICLGLADSLPYIDKY